MSFFKSLLFENYCHYCGVVDNIICLDCLYKKLNNYAIRYVGDKKVLFFYKDDLKIVELIVAFKDKQVRTIGPILSFIIFIGLELMANKGANTVVNVPTSFLNIKKRGGDPISEMVKDACSFNKSKYVYKKNLLRNSQSRVDQVGLDFDARRLNLQNSFKATSLEKRPILLVDDLITTGLSLTEAIRALESKGNFVTGCVVIASK